MIALLHLQLPFDLKFPSDIKFDPPRCEVNGYEIVFEKPVRGNKPQPPNGPESFTIDGKPGLTADVLVIRFRKAEFDRRVDTAMDPPEPLIKEAIRSFIDRLKYVSRASQVQSDPFPQCRFTLSYLNDDESELQPQVGLLRVRIGGRVSFSYLATNSAFWENVWSLPFDFQPPAWHGLLVDARGALPHLGTAVVLAATGLEIFISTVLDRLAGQSVVPKKIWMWINDRGDYRKEPSVDEQYSALLEAFTSHSLKEKAEVWEPFKNLRAARNAFVHQGIPMIGGKELSQEDVVRLIDNADLVVATIREWIPENCRWPNFHIPIQVQISHQVKFDKNIVDRSQSV
jgi:hypothetical protein